MSLTSELKKRFMAVDAVKIEGNKDLPDIWIKPLTVKQAQAIDNEPDVFRNAARQFQVRALDASGNHLLPPAEFEEFITYTPTSALLDIATKMQACDNSLEEVEKNS